MNRIEEALHKLFQKHRVVFWYDEKKELDEQFHSLSLPGVEKKEVESNEFEIKYRILKEQPEQKFLLFFRKAQPHITDNWLLDIELSNYVFQTDQMALYLQELELPMHLKELVGQHEEFFKSKERRLKLKEMLPVEYNEDAIRENMLAVVFNVPDASCVSFLLAHFNAYASETDAIDKELERFNLQQFYWDKIRSRYNYKADEPGIYDFLLEVFNANSPAGKKGNINRESKILLSVWKDAISYQNAFRHLSDKIASDLQVEATMQQMEPEKLLEDDLYRLTDMMIISELSRKLSNGSWSLDETLQIVKVRENKYWFSEFQNFYAALKEAASLLAFINATLPDKIESFSEGVIAYADELYKADQYYRRFIQYYRKINQNRVLEPLAQKIEKVYSNNWLLPLNNEWQHVVNKLETWKIPPRHAHQRFFDNHIISTLKKGLRMFVIVTDGFRYECGEEFVKKMEKEQRFETALDYACTGLPSYTQLGMAALLPNHKMEVVKSNDSVVLVDGLPASGLAGRVKILEKFDEYKATAINAEDFMKMNANTEGREFVKGYDLIYIFHNRVDKTGDEKTTEKKVFEAVQDEMNYLVDIIKKISNMNGTNMLITADHGFIYQNNKLEESDYSVAEYSGDVWESSRRYVIGKNLKGDVNTLHFKADQLGLVGEAEVLIPKSINRFRKSGSGARYVHGGASLQEIVVPVIKINKKRQDNKRMVEVDIIKSTDKITTNILALSFLQSELVGGKVLPRTVRAGIVAGDNELISDQFTYHFDATEGSERQREVKHVFHISNKAKNTYKNQRVKLVLEIPVEGSSKWNPYKEFFYTLNIGIDNEFDEW